MAFDTVQAEINIRKLLNSLGTALFCCKFNLVDTDQFSCEYLVWVLCSLPERNGHGVNFPYIISVYGFVE